MKLFNGYLGHIPLRCYYILNCGIALFFTEYLVITGSQSVNAMLLWQPYDWLDCDWLHFSCYSRKINTMMMTIMRYLVG